LSLSLSRQRTTSQVISGGKEIWGMIVDKVRMMTKRDSQ
jgi:hypothetical protein